MGILLAVDGSEPSEAAVEEVASRLWPVGTTVRVLSAVQTVVAPAAALWYEAGGSVERFQEELARYAGETTTRAAQRLEVKGLTAETAVRHGDPRSVIVDEAEDWDADLIVVGSHGYMSTPELNGVLVPALFGVAGHVGSLWRQPFVPGATGWPEGRAKVG